MITALDKNGEYLMNARLYKRKDYDGASLTKGGVFFKCKLVGSMTQEFEQPVRNLSTDGVRMTIETLYNLDIAIGDVVALDGKTWLADRVFISERESRDKSLGLARLIYSGKKTTIALVEVEL